MHRIKPCGLPKEFQKLSLVESIDGISDSVYFLGERYILKIYENDSDEENILKLLKDLKVPKVIKSFYIDGKKALIMSKIEGISTSKYPLEIVRFLKKMHSFTKNKKTKNKKIFTLAYLEEMLKKADRKIFYELYKEIRVTLKNDGIIHGDLFPDNAKFIGSNLSGVFDFTEACEGDFMFDLAVVCMSFGLDERLALKSYGTKISLNEFKEYIKFAKLYYALSRYLHKKKDYKEFL